MFIRREKMAAALASSNSKSFRQQVHLVNKSNKPLPASSIDGVSGSNHTSQLFSSKLERLLNSQPSTECDSLHSSLLSSLSADDLKAVSISEECVVDAFSHLNVANLIYTDDLLGDLCRLGVGCHWDSLFAGALCYADYLVLLAPSPSSLRIMLNCCENFDT